MVMVCWGKRFKHGTGRVSQNRDKALQSFFHAARKGASAAIVHAGLRRMETDVQPHVWKNQETQMGVPTNPQSMHTNRLTKCLNTWKPSNSEYDLWNEDFGIVGKTWMTTLKQSAKFRVKTLDQDGVQLHVIYIEEDCIA